ncbi:hypothetical protein CYMTET_21545 [Cymbomonas tetramitiformis]|uniref:DCD domain-containing protein n=1 Tax=Cymbomonas tetramitiformis TaxID=36881 RepID=A0AAE0L362_9CHLO|nr:hypothetical protein CYMTET_21545 [Cymbomonas tetramitiformis]
MGNGVSCASQEMSVVATPGTEVHPGASDHLTRASVEELVITCDDVEASTSTPKPNEKVAEVPQQDTKTKSISNNEITCLIVESILQGFTTSEDADGLSRSLETEGSVFIVFHIEKHSKFTEAQKISQTCAFAIRAFLEEEFRHHDVIMCCNSTVEEPGKKGGEIGPTFKMLSTKVHEGQGTETPRYGWESWEPWETVELRHVEHKAYHSSCVIVVLSEGSMQNEACALAMLLGDAEEVYPALKENKLQGDLSDCHGGNGQKPFRNQNVILVHCVQSSKFPAMSTYPKWKTGGNAPGSCFHSKAIPYINEYKEKALGQIKDYLFPLLKEDSSRSADDRPRATARAAGISHTASGSAKETAANAECQQSGEIDAMPQSIRLFLSHNQKEGSYAVHRIKEALNGMYTIFLDVDTTFKIHKLEDIVKSSVTVVVYLTKAYLRSEFCVLELATAVRNKRHRVWVRDFDFDWERQLDDEGRCRALHETIDKVKARLKWWTSEYEEEIVNEVHEGYRESLIYHAEFFHEFLPRLKNRIGVADAALNVFKMYCQQPVASEQVSKQQAQATGESEQAKGEQQKNSNVMHWKGIENHCLNQDSSSEEPPDRLEVCSVTLSNSELMALCDQCSPLSLHAAPRRVLGTLHFTHLELSGCNLQDVGLSILSKQLLEARCELITLNLSNNQITAHGLTGQRNDCCLSELLATNHVMRRTLRTLILSYNSLGQSKSSQGIGHFNRDDCTGILELMEALQFYTTVEELKLDSCKLRERSAGALAKGLALWDGHKIRVSAEWLMRANGDELPSYPMLLTGCLGNDRWREEPHSIRSRFRSGETFSNSDLLGNCFDFVMLEHRQLIFTKDEPKAVWEGFAASAAPCSFSYDAPLKGLHEALQDAEDIDVTSFRCAVREALFTYDQRGDVAWRKSYSDTHQWQQLVEMARRWGGELAVGDDTAGLGGGSGPQAEYRAALAASLAARERWSPLKTQAMCSALMSLAASLRGPLSELQGNHSFGERPIQQLEPRYFPALAWARPELRILDCGLEELPAGSEASREDWHVLFHLLQQRVGEYQDFVKSERPGDALDDAVSEAFFKKLKRADETAAAQPSSEYCVLLHSSRTGREAAGRRHRGDVLWMAPEWRWAQWHDHWKGKKLPADLKEHDLPCTAFALEYAPSADDDQTLTARFPTILLRTGLNELHSFDDRKRWSEGGLKGMPWGCALESKDGRAHCGVSIHSCGPSSANQHRGAPLSLCISNNDLTSYGRYVREQRSHHDHEQTRVDTYQRLRSCGERQVKYLETLCRALGVHSRVRELYLECVNLQSRRLRVQTASVLLADVLRMESNGIQKLNVRANDLGGRQGYMQRDHDEDSALGLACLGKALRSEHCKLTNLDLSDNNIDAAALQLFLGQVAECSTKLSVLALNLNPICSRSWHNNSAAQPEVITGVESLQHFIRESRLQFVDLRKTGIGPKAACLLAKPFIGTNEEGSPPRDLSLCLADNPYLVDKLCCPCGKDDSVPGRLFLAYNEALADEAQRIVRHFDAAEQPHHIEIQNAEGLRALVKALVPSSWATTSWTSTRWKVDLSRCGIDKWLEPPGDKEGRHADEQGHKRWIGHWLPSEDGGTGGQRAPLPNENIVDILERCGVHLGPGATKETSKKQDAEDEMKVLLQDQSQSQKEDDHSLAGYIFACNKNTVDYCLTNQLFGSPPNDWRSIEMLDRDTALFLFNHSTQELHGVFHPLEISKNRKPLDEGAWMDARPGCTETPYPAQVRVTEADKRRHGVLKPHDKRDYCQVVTPPGWLTRVQVCCECTDCMLPN